jgi:NADH:ubiquinone oxidoreductase subunit K
MPSISILISFFIIFIGLLGVCIRRGTFVFLFISLEIALLGFGLAFNLLSFFYSSGEGYVMALALITVTAVEAVVGLGLLVLYYNLFQSANEQFVMYYLQA